MLTASNAIVSVSFGKTPTNSHQVTAMFSNMNS